MDKDDEADLEDDEDMPFAHPSTSSSIASPAQPSTINLSSDSVSTLKKQKRSELEAEIHRLRRKLSDAQWHAQAAQIHATMVALECEELTQKINTKKRRKEAEPTISVAGVRWRTGPIGCAMMDAHDAEVEAKRQKKVDAATKKSQIEVDRQSEVVKLHLVHCKLYTQGRWVRRRWKSYVKLRGVLD